VLLLKAYIVDHSVDLESVGYTSQTFFCVFFLAVLNTSLTESVYIYIYDGLYLFFFHNLTFILKSFLSVHLLYALEQLKAPTSENHPVTSLWGPLSEYNCTRCTATAWISNNSVFAQVLCQGWGHSHPSSLSVSAPI